MTIPSLEATLEFRNDATLGEGPVWDERKAMLYWVDILSGKLFQYNPYKKTNRSYDMGEHLGAVALRQGGGLVMAMQSGFAFFDLEQEQITSLVDPESLMPGNRFNDGKCDPSGKFWAGTLSYAEEEEAGSLYCLNENLQVDLKLQNLSISNGMAWNKKRNKFFFIDTPTRNILGFDYDKESAAISNPSVIKTIEKAEGYPDGMTIDEEGCVWVALYDGSKVIRIDPASGEILFKVHVPVPQVTSCTFGGTALDELYITTARENMTKQEIAQHPLSGSLFKAKLPFKGSAASRFAG